MPTCTHCEEAIHEQENYVRVCEHTYYHGECAIREQQRYENIENEEQFMLECETCRAQQAIEFTLHLPHVFPFLSGAVNFYIAIQFFAYLIHLGALVDDDEKTHLGFYIYLISGVLLMFGTLFLHTRIQYEGEFAIPVVILDGVVGLTCLIVYSVMLPLVWTTITLPDVLYMGIVLVYSIAKMSHYVIRQHNTLRKFIYETSLERKQNQEEEDTFPCSKWLATEKCSFCGHTTIDFGTTRRSPCGHYELHVDCILEHAHHHQELECAYCGKVCILQKERTFWFLKGMALCLALVCDAYLYVIMILFVYPMPVPSTNATSTTTTTQDELLLPREIPTLLHMLSALAGYIMLFTWIMIVRWKSAKHTDYNIFEKTMVTVIVLMFLIIFFPLFLLSNTRWSNIGWTEALFIFSHAPYCSSMMDYTLPALRKWARRYCYLIRPVSKQV